MLISWLNRARALKAGHASRVACNSGQRDVPSYSLPRVSRGATALNIREFILIQQALFTQRIRVHVR